MSARSYTGWKPSQVAICVYPKLFKPKTLHRYNLLWNFSVEIVIDEQIKEERWMQYQLKACDPT